MRMVAAITTDADTAAAWDALSLGLVKDDGSAPDLGPAFMPPAGYSVESADETHLAAGGRLLFLRLVRDDSAVGDALSLEEGGSDADSGSTTSGLREARASPPERVETPLYLPEPTAPASAAALSESCPQERPLDDVLTRFGAMRISAPTPAAIAVAAQALVADNGAQDDFYIVDLGVLERSMDFWRTSFPRVDPHYAVKCFSDLGLMTALAAMGAGFDCASQTEVALAVRAGVDVSTRVIYANPCKKPSELEAMRRSGCDLTTYDSVEELEKIAAIFPGCRVVVRIAACDPEARCQLGNKYGAPAEEWERLIDAALEHGLPLVGVAFHVGSGSRAPAAFAQAIADAKVVFDLADARGLNLEILDIGGGFSPDYDPSTGRLSLGGVPAAINAALDEHFPAHAPDAPRVIAEPGRYFAMHSATFCTQITGVRQRKDRPERHLFIADGLYGSFNCSVYDGVRLGETAVLAAPAVDARRLDGAAWVRSEVPSQEDEAATAIAMVKTDVFGPTCDGMDQVLKGAHLPRDVKLGDWLVWPSFGAYTLAGAKDFNGLNVEGFPSLYVYSAAHALVEKNALSHVGGGSFSTCELGGDARR